MKKQPLSVEDLKLLSHKDIVRFALFCAEQVRDNWKNSKICVAGIEGVERWLEGKATAEECRNASIAVASATRGITNAAYYANATADDAACGSVDYSATPSAVYSAWCASACVTSYVVFYDQPQAVKEQWEYYEELLHFDDIAEKLLLGEIV